jgi:phosphoglucosamine mutase
MSRKRLFGTRGVRGPFGSKVTPELALKLGAAIAGYVGKGKIVVARDPRTSGEILSQAFISGALAGGLNVIDIGIAPSPCLAFTTRELKADGGVVITASHNPPTDNGFAFYSADGMEFVDDQELRIEGLVFDSPPKGASWESLGEAEGYDEAIPKYIEAIKEDVKVNEGFKVVVDCANGAASDATPRLLEELGCEVVPMNSKMDGSFPGRNPEPQPWNLKDLMRAVKETGADVGLAHDTDADRIAAIDENGSFVKHDALIALFAKRAVEGGRGGVVITSVNTSVSIEEVVERAGGRVLRTPLGDIHSEIPAQRAVFAGEPGKLIFPEFGLWMDGIYGAAKILEVMSSEKKPLSEIISEIPDYPMYQHDFYCPEEAKAGVMRKMRNYLIERVAGTYEVLEIDGVRINRKNGSWILIRPSGTEPKIRVVVEGRTEDEMKTLRQIAALGVKRFLNAA